MEYETKYSVQILLPAIARLIVAYPFLSHEKGIRFDDKYDPNLSDCYQRKLLLRDRRTVHITKSVSSVTSSHGKNSKRYFVTGTWRSNILSPYGCVAIIVSSLSSPIIALYAVPAFSINVMEFSRQCRTVIGYSVH